MADADPEHEVDDRPAPADRVVQAPDADAFPEQPADRYAQQAEHGDRRKEAQPPAERRLALERSGDRIGHGFEVVPAQNQGRAAPDGFLGIVQKLGHRRANASTRG